jgi:predicted TIM-barrel fold metal-dependent hydrolase
MSETSVAVLSGAPNTRALGAPNIASRDQMKEIIDRLAGSPRLLIHGNLELERGDSELDYMEELADAYHPSAWKMYPHEGAALMDSDEYAPAFVERALALGVPLVAAHRGLWDNAGYAANSSPADLIRFAAGAPEMNVLVYHSGYERRTDENHPYDPDATDHFGVDRMIRALLESGIGPNGNVYAELGSTWVNIMNDPGQAGHVLGKLLQTIGPDRILYGTDCLYNGNPQSQIAALRMFQIPDQLQQEFGYPALTAEMKAKIFGLNAARIYGVDVSATRAAISADDVTELRMAMLDDPRSVPLPDRRRFEGPRTRRQYLDLIKRERFYRHV